MAFMVSQALQGCPCILAKDHQGDKAANQDCLEIRITIVLVILTLIAVSVAIGAGRAQINVQAARYVAFSSVGVLVLDIIAGFINVCLDPSCNGKKTL
ncbi:MAG: hypothetical protein ACKVOH_05580 [Chlamydiales bacterium]